MTATRFCCTVFILSLFIGCTRTDETTGFAIPGGGSVTLWTTKSELFMEYPALVVGNEARFAVHLTWISDFKPVTEGRLSLFFKSPNGSEFATAAGAPTSPGIFRPTMTFNQPGKYDLTMIIEGSSRDTMHVKGLHVFSSPEEIPIEEESQGEQLITFLKEQQWNTDFRTEPAERRPMVGTIRAACEIIPKLNNEAIVSAPFTGTIPSEDNASLPIVGQRVERGERLAVMTPSAETAGGVENFASRFIEAKSDREFAAKEFDRAKQLHASGLISEKEYQETEAEFKQSDATYQTLSKYVQSSSDGESLDGFTLRAPLSGTIIETHVVPGRQVDAGEPLYRIINTSALWIRANVSSIEIGKLTRPNRAWLQLAGVDELIAIDEHNGKLISIAPAADPATRTFPVVFEILNVAGSLKVGMFGEVSIGAGQEMESLVIPESAVIEEEGRFSVYVHVEGESFAKRDVVLGARNGKYISVLKGLSEGEHVVTTGAYQVRLASLSSQLPAHGHEH